MISSKVKRALAMKRFDKLMEEWELNLTNLLESIKNAQAIIAGEFILGCFESRFAPTSLTIYVAAGKASQFLNLVRPPIIDRLYTQQRLYQPSVDSTNSIAYALFKHTNENRMIEIRAMKKSTDMSAYSLMKTIDLDILQMCYLNGKMEYTAQAKKALIDESVSLVSRERTWQEWNIAIDKVIELIKKLPNVFTGHVISRFSDESKGIWQTIWNTLEDQTQIVQHIINWNARMLNAPESMSLAMFLLTLKPHEKPTLRDLFIAIQFERMPFLDLWRVPWEAYFERDKQFIFKVGFRDKKVLTHRHLQNGMYAPIHLDKIMLMDNTAFDSVYVSGVLPQTCFHLLESDPEFSIQLFIEEDKENLVFLNPLPQNNGYTAACYNRAYLNQTMIFYECLETTTQDVKRSVVKKPYYRLPVFADFPFFLTEANYNELVNSTNQYWMHYRTPFELSLTVRKEVFEHTEDWVSADHCQKGTNKSLTVLVPINPNSVFDENGKWRKKGKKIKNLKRGQYVEPKVELDSETEEEEREEETEDTDSEWDQEEDSTIPYNSYSPSYHPQTFVLEEEKAALDEEEKQWNEDYDVDASLITPERDEALFARGDALLNRLAWERAMEIYIGQLQTQIAFIGVQADSSSSAFGARLVASLVRERNVAQEQLQRARTESRFYPNWVDEFSEETFRRAMQDQRSAIRLQDERTYLEYQERQRH